MALKSHFRFKAIQSDSDGFIFFTLITLSFDIKQTILRDFPKISG